MAKMSHTLRDLLFEHSTNPVHETGLTTSPSKLWAKQYPPDLRLEVHTTREASGAVEAVFDGPLFPAFEDDELRLEEPVSPPTYRKYRLRSEGDMTTWFDAEVSNIVLGGFARFPSVLQASFEKPLGEEPELENIDTSYSVQMNGKRFHIAIGEYKRNIIDIDQWQKGRLTRPGQRNLARELRGYVALCLTDLHLSLRCPGMPPSTAALRSFVLMEGLFCYCNSRRLLQVTSRAQIVSPNAGLSHGSILLASLCGTLCIVF